MSPYLSKLFSRSKNSLFLVDQENFLVETCNAAALASLGIPLSEISGKNIDEFYTINTSKSERIIQEIKENGVYHRRDKISQNVFSIIQVLDEGSQKCLVSIENSEDPSANYLKLPALEENVAGYIKLNKDLLIVDCNNSFASQLNYKAKEQLINRSFYEVFPREDDVKELIKQTVKFKKLNNHEIKLLCKHGHEKIFLSNILLEKSDTGENEGVSFTLIDISSRVEFENQIKQSEERFKLLSDVAIESIAILSQKQIVDCNDQFINLVGFKNQKDVLGSEITEFISETELHKIYSGSQNHRQTEIVAKKRDGTIMLLETSFGKITQDEEELDVFLFYEVTQRKKTEIALEQSTERYKNLVEHSPNGICILVDHKIKFVNNAAMQMLGAEFEDDLFDTDFLNYVSNSEKKEIKGHLNSTREGGELEYQETELKTVNDETFHAGIQASLTVYNNKPAIQITIIDLKTRILLREERIRNKIAEETNAMLTEEIEQHKMTQEKLQSAQHFTRNIIESSIDMIIAVDKTGTITEFNQAAIRQFGYELHEVIGKKVNILYAKEHDFNHVRDSIESNNQFTGEITNKRKNGEEFISLLSSSVIKTKDGNVQGSMGVSRDITRRKMIEKQIQDSLKEKEVLLQEVHHRVKNNLQVISSILSLQSNYVKDEKTLEILDESQNRINSMSYIHETLYQTTDFSSIEFSNYLDRLARNLIHSYSYSAGEVKLVTDYDEIYLDINHAIPCGLIVNELVSNALKYAFPKKAGTIHLSIKQKDNFITLKVQDNGVGLPKDFKYEESDSLGMQLVYSLVDQIDASLELDGEKGTRFLITFEHK